MYHICDLMKMKIHVLYKNNLHFDYFNDLHDLQHHLLGLGKTHDAVVLLGLIRMQLAKIERIANVRSENWT